MAETDPGGPQDDEAERLSREIDRVTDSIATHTETMVLVEGLPCYFPKAPLMLNGEAYTFKVDEERLGGVTRYVNNLKNVSRKHKLRALRVKYGARLHPTLTGEDEKPAPPPYSRRDDSINIVLPQHIDDAQMREEDLALLVQDRMNIKLGRGLNQNAYFREALTARNRLREGGVIFGALVGELIATAVSRHEEALAAFIGKGLGGVALGGAVGFGLAKLPDAYRDIKDNSVGEGLTRAANKNAVNMPDPMISRMLESDPTIITLVPVEEMAKPGMIG